jgi:triosephosphate isomerase
MPTSKPKKIFVGNWKMNALTVPEVEARIRKLAQNLKNSKSTVVICPPFPYLGAFKKKPAQVALGAQDIFFEEKGSFTGQVSAEILKLLNVSHVIIGHSERRQLGESDETVNKKVLIALKSKITPIICIGETTRDEEGNYLALIKEQIEKALVGVSKNELSKIIIAYEPVWAIGATAAMAPRDVHEMTIYIKKMLTDLYKVKTRVSIPILYGGAVDPLNARALLADGEADGFLVGRQSLDPKNFLEIIRSA